MPLSDYTQNIGGTGLALSINTTTPLVASGSLAMVATTASAGSGVNIYKTTGNKGFVKGRIRTILRARVLFTGSSLFNVGAGIVCMQGALNVTANNAANDAYILGLGYSNTLANSPNYRWFVRKMPSGFGAVPAGAEYLYEGATFSVTATNFWPIELEWAYDLAGLGGTRLTSSVGTLNSLDYGTLAVIDDRVDTSTPFSTSVAEGLCLFHRYSATESHAWDFDTTEIYSLA